MGALARPAGRDQNFWFRTTNPDASAIFSTPAPGTFSTTQTRNAVLRDVGFQNWNAALFKDFVPREGQRIQFRCELFNWPNHPNWGGVNTNPRSGAFGKVNGKGSERNIQLSLRYSL